MEELTTEEIVNKIKGIKSEREEAIKILYNNQKLRKGLKALIKKYNVFIKCLRHLSQMAYYDVIGLKIYVI